MYMEILQNILGSMGGNSNSRHSEICLIYKYNWENPVSPPVGENQYSLWPYAVYRIYEKTCNLILE